MKALEAENARLRVELEHVHREAQSARRTIVGLPQILISVSATGSIVYMNTAAQRHFGIDEKQAFQLPLRVLTSPSLRGEELQSLSDIAWKEGTASRQFSAAGAKSEFEVRADRSEGGVQILAYERNIAATGSSSLARRFSTTVIREMGAMGLDLESARRQEATVVVSALSGFDSSAKALPAGAASQMCDEFLTLQTEVALEAGGMLGSIQGPEVAVLFGMPASSSDHASTALRAALEMRDAQKSVLDAWRRRGAPALGVSIGIATGDLLAGTFGPARRREFAAAGPAMRIASAFATSGRTDEVLVSNRTLDLVREAISRKPFVLSRSVKFRRGDGVHVPGIEGLAESIQVVDA